MNININVQNQKFKVTMTLRENLSQCLTFFLNWWELSDSFKNELKKNEKIHSENYEAFLAFTVSLKFYPRLLIQNKNQKAFNLQ